MVLAILCSLRELQWTSIALFVSAIFASWKAAIFASWKAGRKAYKSYENV